MPTENAADVVVIGLGASGGTAVLPLTEAGLDVVGIEAGGRYMPRDFPADEIRNDIRNWLGRVKVNNEVPTQRLSVDHPTTPAVAPARMMNAVGGTSIHWTCQSWRLMAWDFKARSETIRRYGASALPAGTTLTDWPVDAAEMERWYDRVEWFHGVSGTAGANPFEAPRARGYPNPPLRRTGWTEFMAAAARRLGWNPFPGPSAIRSEPFNGMNACDYHGFCTWNGCHVSAKTSTSVSTIPAAEKSGRLKIVEHARVTEIVVDADGRAAGVKYVKAGVERFQPAKVVLLATYTYENVRLLLLSRSSAYPNGLSNNHGQVGRHYMSHGLRSVAVQGLFPGKKLNRYGGTGSQWTAIDDWDADNFDHSGLGFIGGGTLSAGMELKPIAAASTTPPSVPRWGAAWKSWLKANANSVGTVSSQVNAIPYEGFFLDLDPTTKDPDGFPVIRVTFDLTDNERRAALFLQQKAREWLLEAGASETWTTPPAPIHITTHAYGGTRMGDDADSNVTDRWGFSHEVPNLAILGASTFPTSGGRNPTETVMALAFRTADHLVQNWSARTG